MSSKPIESIVIVGGGTSGWLSAAFLQHYLNGDPTRPRVEITLIESPDVPIVGVGEATIPSFVRTLKLLGIKEKEFFRHSDGAFKLGIKFAGWKTGAPEEHYYHPFEYPPAIAGLYPWNFWLLRREEGNKEPYDRSMSGIPALCDEMRAPRDTNAGEYTARFGYAYHLDTVKFGRFLRNVVTARGVRHVQDFVERVSLDENGAIGSLETRANGRVTADLYIDCTGFSGLLINKALGVDFVSYGDVLFNDRAIAMSVPYPSEDTPVPSYTSSTAMSAGWIWDISLLTRRGMGYVFSSAFKSDEDAERELRTFAGPEAEKSEARTIPIRVGRNEVLWKKNCVAVGLAGGFIEPLESTGIYLIEVGMKALLDHFPSKEIDDGLVSRYNRHMRLAYEEIRDFVLTHFILSKREDSEYWKAIRNHEKIPDSLAEKLRVWKHRLPGANDIDFSHTFIRDATYLYVLAGMDYLPDRPYTLSALYPRGGADPFFDSVKEKTRLGLEFMPTHLEFLKKIRSGA